MRTLKRLSTEVIALQLRGPRAGAILALQHLPEWQQRFAPLGVLSCSDICSGLLLKLTPSLLPQQQQFLEQIKV